MTKTREEQNKTEAKKKDDAQEYDSARVCVVVLGKVKAVRF